jgi:hypothetical protein
MPGRGCKEGSHQENIKSKKRTRLIGATLLRYTEAEGCYVEGAVL